MMGRIRWAVVMAVVAAIAGVGGAQVAPAGAATSAVVNGGFETGSFSGWTTSGPSTGIVTTAHSGTFGAQLGSASPTNGNSTMQQTVTIPVNATLSFWYQPHCPDTLAHDQEQMQVRTTTGATILRLLNVCSNSGLWTQVTRSMVGFRGLTLVLWFDNHDDNATGTATSTLFDDVTLGPPVAANDFSLSASPSAVTVAPGASATSTISTAVTSGSAQPVSLGAAGLPAGASASFAPATVTAGGSSSLTITTSASTPPGTSTITVTGTATGTGTSATHTTTVSLTVTGGPPPGLLQVSRDGFTNASSEHATEVEPDTLSNGTTLVSAFQVGRFSNGGSDDIGWATSTDNGQTWLNGLLPGITTFQGGTWARASDPSVAYDARRGTWIIASLIVDTSGTGRGVMVSRSSDGLTWANATPAVTSTGAFLDKDWIVCDATATSSRYGNCYVEYDNNSVGNLIQMLTSTDGGATWSIPRQTADGARGLGGQPLVQPGGTVVVPYLADTQGQIRSFSSSDGGSTWASSVLIASSTTHTAAGALRTSALPSAEIDGAGTVYVAWQDCRFRLGCPSNDIVLSTSTDAAAWTAVQRIPIDAASSPVDHFIPGLAVDRGTGGPSAHLGLYYYYYPSAACSSASCQLDVGFVSSADGGTTWSSATQVAGPASLGQIAATTEGAMVGDYISASFLNGRAFGLFALGRPPAGSTYDEAMYTVSGGLVARAGAIPSEIWTGGDPLPRNARPLTAPPQTAF